MYIGQQLADDRFAFYKDILPGIRDQIVFDEEFNAWFVFNVRHLNLLVRDERLLANTKASLKELPLNADTLQVLEQFYSNWVMFTDGDLHKTLRRRVNTLILDRYRNIDYRWGPMDKQGDFSELYAVPYVYNILAQLIGISEKDVALLIKASEQINSLLLRGYLTIHDFDAVAQSIRQAYQLVNDVDSRYRDSDRYVGNALLDLPSEQKYPLLINLVSDGFAPFVAALNFLAYNLLTHPELEQEADSRSDDICAESLRLFPPFTTISRVCSEEVQVGDAHILPGQLVIFDLYSINRDPECFPDPDCFNLANTERAYSFGAGKHLCSGNPLVRKALGAVTKQSGQIYKYELVDSKFINLYGSTDMKLTIKKNTRL
ncbi:cytochrome P450 [Bifidobacterium coryneforme]|uniref:Cytochrome P450-like protein n=1 Tax=Bifidobacterium [indicum] DSM 20214 = LMG 11587 TaxID=1341694 RepID=A0A087VW18_9BIFI|nr:cytochrome P450 [Bifidobacterium indicum]AIC92572.1 Cytochrome P450-like protein [Bifidobacterium indicum LMG 11587 = DSM 20214]